MLNSYKTVKGYGESEQIIQKSRFIAYVNRVESEEEAIQFIQSIKKKHWDATHNCSAYMIGENDLIQKANDDGEPSGTAGVPILEVIKKKGLKDTAVVVTRYFGGIKLGAGGLIRAYGGAASEGINATGVVERRLMRIMKSTFDYTLLGKIENELRNSHYSIKEIHYLDRVMIESYAEEDAKEAFIDWMTDLSNGQASIEEGEMLYLEHDL
ncbi:MULTISPECIES: YigZ family protein [unclassified Bacillus (in: firmicutes)]|uniref:YigZ family protein n=1 Tax=unclassified Bacillus (in: firmicutes) TaxID=185979 RepID=UPI00080AC867|nr:MULTISPECIES: YigZ family protein [unclassified Bacillus (in: firmicutes)]OCA84663.1 YigZ family protein [Bacillus sp. FJAT-27986]